MMTYELTTGLRPAQMTAVMDATVSVTGIEDWLVAAYGRVERVLAAQGLHAVGPPFARYHVLGGGRVRVEAGFPVGTWVDPDAGVHASRLPGGPAVTTLHVGPLTRVSSAYEALSTWVYAHDATVDEDGWEVYLTDPASTPDPVSGRTEIVQPYRPLNTSGRAG